MPTGTSRATDVNKRMVVKAESLFRELFADVLVSGFHGRVVLEAIIQDGVIQYVQEHRERKHKADQAPA